MAKGSGRRRRSRAVWALALVAIAAALSLAVRWFGMGPRGGGEELSFQIEVLNGTRTPGIAMEVAKELRRRGVDVLIVDNAERLDFRESILVDRAGDPRLAKRIARVVGCREIVSQVRERPLVEATYIVGADRLKGRGAEKRNGRS